MRIPEEQLAKWTRQLNDEYCTAQRPVQLTTEQEREISMNVVRTLFEMQEAFIRSGRFKETWDDGHFNLLPLCTVVYRKAMKVGAEFSMSADYEKLALSTHLRCDLLGHMDHGFWNLLLALPEYGELTVVQTGGSVHPIAKDHPHLFKPKGPVYQLMRGHLFSALEGDQDWPTFRLTLSWTKEAHPIGDVVSNGQKSWQALYGLHYALWKARDNRRKEAARRTTRRPTSARAE